MSDNNAIYFLMIHRPQSHSSTTHANKHNSSLALVNFYIIYWYNQINLYYMILWIVILYEKFTDHHLSNKDKQSSFHLAYLTAHVDHFTCVRTRVSMCLIVFCVHQVKILIFRHKPSGLGIVPHNFYTPGIGAIFIGCTTRIGPIVGLVIPDLYTHH